MFDKNRIFDRTNTGNAIFIAPDKAFQVAARLSTVPADTGIMTFFKSEKALKQMQRRIPIQHHWEVFQHVRTAGKGVLVIAHRRVHFANHQITSVS
jgi:hypothetical protein